MPNPDAQTAPTPPSPEALARLRARLDTMFRRHAQDPVMQLIYNTAAKLAAEGKIRG